MPTIITATELRKVLGNPSTTIWSDATLNDIIDTAEGIVLPMLETLESPATYVGNSQVESAVYAISLDVFQSRISAGGVADSLDVRNPQPYKLGRAMFARVTGLLGSLIDVETMIQ